MSKMIQNIPVIIHEPSFDAPKLPKGYKWAYRTDFHPEKVTLTVSIISTKNPISALLFRWQKSKLSTLAQDFPRGQAHDAGAAMQETATFIQRRLYNQLFPAI